MTERTGKEDEPIEEDLQFGDVPHSEEAPASDEGASFGAGQESGGSPEDEGGEAKGGHIPKDTQMHLFRAFSEFAMAMDGMIPKSRMPEEAKDHARAAKKEILLMMRAIIDAKIECAEKKGEEKAPRLRKIKVE